MKILLLFMLIGIILIPSSVQSADEIDVLIKGIDDGIKSSQAKDFAEAVTNAKLQAIERAGVEITAITKVENFQLKSDMIESKAQAILLPGFQILDLGYQPNGSYAVILSGKVRTSMGKTTALRVTFEGVYLVTAASWGSYVKNLKPGEKLLFAYSLMKGLSPVKFYLKNISRPTKAELVRELKYELYSVTADSWCGRNGVPPSEEERMQDLKLYCPEHAKNEKIKCWYICKEDPQKNMIDHYRKHLSTTFDVPVEVGNTYLFWVVVDDYHLARYFNRVLISKPYKIFATQSTSPLIIPISGIGKYFEGIDDPVFKEKTSSRLNIHYTPLSEIDLKKMANKIDFADTIYFEVKHSVSIDSAGVY